jgi:Ca2+-binding EF-hand superfamily protein
MSKRKTVLIIAGALLTVGAVAAISAPGDRGHRMGPMFGGWGDGAMGGKGRWSRQPMTEAEFDANTRSRFARLDSNSDGVIDASEIEAALAQRASRHGDRGERRGERLLRRFDADRDGKVTKDEFMKDVAARFAELDLNNDGRITEEDLPPAMRGRGVLTGNADTPRRGIGRRVLTLLREADANRDGVITRDEAVAGAERRFAALDRNKDGTLDKADGDELRKETADYRVQRFMHRYGADSDRKVTKEQFFAKAKERFARLDRDGDGTVSRGERGWLKGHRWHRHGGSENETPAEQGGNPAPRDK